MRFKISIVVPVYKVVEKLLRACIESCIAQTETVLEIILVDDCSPDNSGAICDEYAAKDSRITVIHKNKNEGLSAARNTGIQFATGEWITFLDGDDWLEPSTCEVIRGVSDDIEMIFFGMKRDYGEVSQDMEFCYPDRKIFNEKECKQLQIDVLDYYKRLSTAYCKFVRREFLVENHILHDPEIRCGIEGIEYNLRLFGYLKKAMSVKQYLYHYVYNLNSITGAPSDETNQYILLGIKRMHEYLKQIGASAELELQFKKRVQRVIMDTSIGCYFNPNYKLSFDSRIQLFKRFIANDEIAYVMEHCECYETAPLKKVIYFCTKHRLYAVLLLFGTARVIMLSRS